MKIAGVQVDDSKDALRVDVTAADIKGATTKDGRSCAVARALVRQTGAEEARVHLSRAYVKRRGKWRRYQVPSNLRQEVVTFDRAGSFEPGEYELQPIPSSKSLTAPSPKRTKAPAHKVRRYRHTPNVRDTMKADWE